MKKYTKEIVEKATNDAESIAVVREKLGLKSNSSYVHTLLKQYGLSAPHKKSGRPNIKNTVNIRKEIAEKNKLDDDKLFLSTKFLDNLYDNIPYQQRTWHIRHNKLEPEYCICGNLMTFMTKRYKYCSRICTNNVADKKRESTIFKKYGVKNAFQSDTVKEKMQQTCFKKYGVSNGGAHSNGHYKDYVLPSGRIIRVQGFEHYALDILLKTYDETDILFGPKEIHNELGLIFYSHKNTRHKYFPDFYIKSINKIIEVKSTWTYDRKGRDPELRQINEYKRVACLEKKLDFEFFIMDKFGSRLKMKTNLL